jgi:hypothetical protein
MHLAGGGLIQNRTPIAGGIHDFKTQSFREISGLSESPARNRPSRDQYLGYSSKSCITLFSDATALVLPAKDTKNFLL